MAAGSGSPALLNETGYRICRLIQRIIAAGYDFPFFSPGRGPRNLVGPQLRLAVTADEDYSQILKRLNQAADGLFSACSINNGDTGFGLSSRRPCAAGTSPSIIFSLFSDRNA